MKKIFLSVLIGMVLLSSFAIVSAQGTEIFIKLVQKNPTTWQPVVNGMSSTLFLYQMMTSEWTPCSFNPSYSCKTYKYVDYFSVSPSGRVKPNTDYTLVYYGYGSHNDEWNYVTCIKSKNSGYYGYLSFGGKYDWTKFLNDGKQQKFWIVESSDVDCLNHKFKQWNPNNILFETKTI